MSGRVGRQKFDNAEERHYLTWDKGSAHTRVWLMRTAIFHYSNGTNKCSVVGCTANVDSLTLEHENFDRVELNRRLGIRDLAGGKDLAGALIVRGFPDVGLTVKCMYHNSLNKSPKHGIGKNKSKSMDETVSNYQKEYKRRLLQKAYTLYGYTDSPDGMSWEHSYNDGKIHRLYLTAKYSPNGIVTAMTGYRLAGSLMKEYAANLPFWPGLIVMHMNDNHIGSKARIKVAYDTFWTEARYKPFRDSLTAEQTERIINA